MNILLSSYSCNPFKGSENAVGWKWLMELSKRFNGSEDKIWMITKQFNAAAMRKGIAQENLKNVELVIVDVPPYLNWFREKYSAFHHMYYILWQKAAYRWVKQSGISFDIIHHITMGNFRIPGDMCKVKDVYTIFGPVGGGQTTPSALRSYYGTKNRLYEAFRDFSGFAVMQMPQYKKKLRAFDAIYAVNEETKEKMEKASGRPCKKICDIAIPDAAKTPVQKLPHGDTVNIIYLGRLIELKGLMFLMDVAKQISTKTPYHITLYGAGELKASLQSKIQQYHLEETVSVHDPIPYEKVDTLYNDADIFVHPTFRDSSGAVFVEAMDHRLPIVALNNSIGRDLNENGCGLFANTAQSKEDIINEFAENIVRLIEDPGLRQELGENGYNYAHNALTMDAKCNEIYGAFLKG